MRGRPPQLPWRRRPAARPLAGAHAARSVRRSLTRKAGRAVGLRRLTGWLRPLTAAPPSLAEDEPLGILPALVEETARPSHEDERPSGVAARAEVAEQARRSRRRARDRADTRRQRRRRAHAATAGGAGGASGANAAGGDEGTGGGAAGVRRRAGDPALPSSRRRPRPDLPHGSVVVRRALPPPAPATVARPRAASTQAPAARRRFSPPAMAGVSGTRRTAQPVRPRVPEPTGAALTEALLVRAERRLATAFRSAAAADRGDAPPAPDVLRAALAAQWTTVVTGRCAPPDLLRSLVSDQSSSGAGSAPTGARRGHAPAAFTPGLGADVAGHRTPRAPDAGRGASARTEPIGPLSPPLASAAAETPRAPLRALASDVPARGLGAAAEAAARLRLPAAQDSQPGEDLDALAANVKRILDREARRHGIDV